jgi:hypothetical protein
VKGRSRAILGALLVSAAFALEALGRRHAPSRPDWLEELHPLLGAAPASSFAREADRDPLVDFRGRPFPRRRTGTRVLVVGGDAAVRLLPEIERALSGAEVVSAAREGFGVAQEAAVLGRFGPAIDPSVVVAVDGEELLSSPSDAGATSEWEWSRSAIDSPIGESLARVSGAARLLFVKRLPVLEAGQARTRYVEGARAVRVLASGRHVRLLWALAPSSGLDGASRAALAREIEKNAPPYDACDSPDEIVRRLKSS